MTHAGRRVSPMPTLDAPPTPHGFTVFEIMITITVIGVVIMALASAVYTGDRPAGPASKVDTAASGRAALDLMTRDLRSAGYGCDVLGASGSQPPIAYIDSLQVLINENLTPSDSSAARTRPPLAYDPTGRPRPQPLVASAWTPPSRYPTGAETVRWTLDLNNDGALNAADLATTLGADAQRTPNPNDYVLVRQVYGDSTRGIAGDNGGAPQNMALVRRPASDGTPPLLTVYLRGQPGPWDWSHGPLPKSQLGNVERIQVRLVSEDSRPDWRGNFAPTPLVADVTAFRLAPGAAPPPPSAPSRGTHATPDSAGHSTPDSAASSRGPTGAIRGVVWEDRDRNGARNGAEPGLEHCWVGVVTESGDVVAFARSDASGEYRVDVPALGSHCRLECVPLPGMFPTTSTAVPDVAVAPHATLADQNFGLASFQRLDLSASRVLSLACGDVIEKDWNGGQTQAARRDIDLIAGADAGGTDQLSVWFNHFDANPLFGGNRDYARTAPNAVLSVAVDTLGTDPPPFRDRADVVTGTRLAPAGNVFVWLNQNASGNEGFLPTSYTAAYKTLDDGDATAVVTGDVTGGSGVDLIVGTRSPSQGRGTLELWRSNDAASPTFTRVETYPPAGQTLGEVTGMALTRLRPSGQDLVVGTRTGEHSGQILVFGRADTGSVFTLRWQQSIADGAVTALTVCDVTQDGRNDVVVGIQDGATSGRVELWENATSGGTLSLRMLDRRARAGIPTALASADLGGRPGPDVVVGWRADETGWDGGLGVYYCDGGRLPTVTVDPSGGAVTHAVTALAPGCFNDPPKGAGRTTDFAAGVRSATASGSLELFIR